MKVFTTEKIRLDMGKAVVFPTRLPRKLKKANKKAGIISMTISVPMVRDIQSIILSEVTKIVNPPRNDD